MLSVVRGHHVYKAVWTQFVGKILNTRSWTLTLRVFENSMAFSPAWGEDLMQDYWQKTRRQCGLGLVVPCVCKFQGKEKVIVRLREVIDKRN